MDFKDFYFQNVRKQAEFFKGDIGPCVPYFFTILEIELSNYCILDCPFCYTGSLSRRRTFLPFEHYKKLVDYLVVKDLRPRISFSGDGEMFTHQRILDCIRYAKDRGFHVQIITNGILCHPEKSKKLVEMGLDRIQFSIDSIRRETYGKSRKSRIPGKNHFDTALHNILEYARLNYTAGEPTAISVMSVQTEITRHESEEFRSFWNQLPIHNIFLSPLYTLAGNASKIFAEADRSRFKGDGRKKPVCVSPFILLCVKADGKVLSCTHDSNAVYPIGNIIEDGSAYDNAPGGVQIERTIEIDRLWNNERIQYLRKCLIERDVEDFKEMGHDCESCNCPLEDGSIDEYIEGVASAKVKKIWEGMNRGCGFRSSPEKYRNLIREIESRYLNKGL